MRSSAVAVWISCNRRFHFPKGTMQPGPSPGVSAPQHMPRPSVWAGHPRALLLNKLKNAVYNPQITIYKLHIGDDMLQMGVHRPPDAFFEGALNVVSSCP